MKRLLLTLSAALTLFSTAQAHPSGHEGGFIDTARHILTQPDHLIMIGSAAVIGATIVMLSAKRSRAAKK